MSRFVVALILFAVSGQIAGADENVDGDLADPVSLRGALDGVAAVVHLAALTHSRNPKRYDAVNVGGTRALLASTPASVQRFVLVSSRAVSPEGGAYSRSKLAAEAAVHANYPLLALFHENARALPRE